MSYIKQGERIQEVLPSLSLQPNLDAEEPYKKLLAGVKSVCKIYEVPFQELINEEKYREEIKKWGLGSPFAILATMLAGLAAESTSQSLAR